MSYTVALDSTISNAKSYFDPSLYKCIYFSPDTVELKTPCDILICRSHTKVNKRLLGGIDPKIVGTVTSGTDHVDVEYLNRRGIKFIDAKGGNAQAVAEYIFSIFNMLAVDPRFKVGIIGVGHVGQRVYQQLYHLKYQTVCFDPPKQVRDPSFNSANFSDLYCCDVITIHVPYIRHGSFRTHHLCNHHFLNKLKDGTILINTSRGEIMNENDLIGHAQRLQLCLDVFTNEPAVNRRLVSLCSIATPHIAGHSHQARDKALAIVYQKITSQISGASVDNDYKFNQRIAGSMSIYCRDIQTVSEKFKNCSDKDCFQDQRSQHQYSEVLPYE